MWKLVSVSLFLVALVLGVSVEGPPGQGRPSPAGRSGDASKTALLDVASHIDSQDCPEQSILPAYFYPGPAWDEALATATAGSTIIVNPSSGPGDAVDPEYQQVVNEANAKGVRLVGYINTMYGSVSVTDVDQQITDYRAWYGITGIFFDDVSNQASELGYYQSVSDDARAGVADPVVMINPGTYPDPSYATLGDIIFLFEGPYSSYLTQQPPQWVDDYPASMFGSLVSGVPASQVPATLALAETRNTSLIYLTDQAAGSTLYEQLPSYWSTEIEDIAALCPSSGEPGGPDGAVGSAGPDGGGYWLVGSDGGVFAFGGAQFHGSTGNLRLNKPIVGMARTPDDDGYWLVASDGGVFAFGDARFEGSTGNLRLNKPIVGMAATPDGAGYWLVASDGGVFAFGDARFEGSTGNLRLNKPIVGMAATPDGGGYWLVASDGGVFAFGDAKFYGSTGDLRLNEPIVGMAATPDDGGYWLVASDGGVFAFGDARFEGSTGNLRLNKPIVGMAATPGGGGYWLVASDGGVFAFGDARFEGSTGNLRLNKPIVALG